LPDADFASASARLSGIVGAVLHWSPDQFWRATPLELTCWLEALVPEATSAPDPETIARLKEQFPDG
jgi:hypothetical protein